MNRLLAIGEAAKVLGVSISTLRRWEKEGKLMSESTGSSHPVSFLWRLFFGTYPIYVTYRYTVSGRIYQNDRFSYERDRFYFKRTALNIINRYPAGSRCYVYYNPANPSEVVIDRTPLNLFLFFLASTRNDK